MDGLDPSTQPASVRESNYFGTILLSITRRGNSSTRAFVIPLCRRRSLWARNATAHMGNADDDLRNRHFTTAGIDGRVAGNTAEQRVA